MTRTADDAAAVAMLFRSLLAYLARGRDLPELRHWGEELHDRFALPYYLQRDLREVLLELTTAGLGLPAVVADRLLDDAHVQTGTADLDGVQLVVRRAHEFWPLTGSLSTPESTSRWMDSSTERLEVQLIGPLSQEKKLRRWTLMVGGRRVPWRLEKDEGRCHLLRGVRYKSFDPQMPLWPQVQAYDPFVFRIQNADRRSAWEIRCHSWRPDGRDYHGLPADFAEALQRQRERFVVKRARYSETCVEVPERALTPFSLDVRRLARVGSGRTKAQRAKPA